MRLCLLILVTWFLVPSSLLAQVSQKECDKRLFVLQDEFSGKREIRSKESIKLIDFPGKGLVRQLLEPTWELHSLLSRSIGAEVTPYLIFLHTAIGETARVSGVRSVEIKFKNDSLVTLDTPQVLAQREGRRSASQVTVFALSDPILDFLSHNTIAMMRVSFVNLPRVPVAVAELDEKKASEMQLTATCLVRKVKDENVPAPAPPPYGAAN